MKRRGFLASLFAPLIARFVPKQAKAAPPPADPSPWKTGATRDAWYAPGIRGHRTYSAVFPKALAPGGVIFYNGERYHVRRVDDLGSMLRVEAIQEFIRLVAERSCASGVLAPSTVRHVPRLFETKLPNSFPSQTTLKS